MPRILTTTLLLGLLIASAGSVGGCDRVSNASSPIVGVWAPSTYELSTGESHHLRGQIFFGEKRWSVVFFVDGPGGEPRRASAEGGRYQLEGNVLTLVHDYHFAAGHELAGLPKTELNMHVADLGDGQEEKTTVEWSGEVMTVEFPSGNRMRFVHVEGDR